MAPALPLAANLLPREDPERGFFAQVKRVHWEVACDHSSVSFRFAYSAHYTRSLAAAIRRRTPATWDSAAKKWVARGVPAVLKTLAAIDFLTTDAPAVRHAPILLRVCILGPHTAVGIGSGCCNDKAVLTNIVSLVLGCGHAAAAAAVEKTATTARPCPLFRSLGGWSCTPAAAATQLAVDRYGWVVPLSCGRRLEAVLAELGTRDAIGGKYGLIEVAESAAVEANREAALEAVDREAAQAEVAAQAAAAARAEARVRAEVALAVAQARAEAARIEAEARDAALRACMVQVEASWTAAKVPQSKWPFARAQFEACPYGKWHGWDRLVRFVSANLAGGCDCARPWTVSRLDSSVHQCRYFGTFRCSYRKCRSYRKTWKSGLAVRGGTQRCKQCNGDEDIFEKQPLQFAERIDQDPDRFYDRASHDEERCSECRKLWRSEDRDLRCDGKPSQRWLAHAG